MRERFNHAFDQILCPAINPLGELNFAFQDLLVDAEWGFVEKWWVAHEHFVGEDAKSPPVYSLAMSLRLDDLGSKVLWCAAEGESSFRNLQCR